MEGYTPMYEKTLARNKLRVGIINEQGLEGWNLFRAELLENASVEILDSTLLEGVTKEKAFKYLNESIQIYGYSKYRRQLP